MTCRKKDLLLDIKMIDAAIERRKNGPEKFMRNTARRSRDELRERPFVLSFAEMADV